MEKMEILLGFHFPEFEKELTTALYNLGYDAKIIEKHTKMQIREYILMHRECRVVILKERDNTMSYTAEDFAILTDENDDLNVICVLSEERRGTDYMQILYAAGITNAVIQNGREGVRPAHIAELCLKKRSRKDARKYYGIASVDIDIGMLSPEAYSIYYQSLFNEENGRTLILRYLNVASRLTAAQNEDFINRLPNEIIDELREYEEFYVIVDGLKAHGIDLKFKRPKHVKIGMEQAPTLTLPQKKSSPAATQTKPKPKPKVEVAGAFDFGEEFSSGFDFGDEFADESDDLEEEVIEEEPFFLSEEGVEEGESDNEGSVESAEEKEEPKKKKFPIKPIYLVIGGCVLLLVAVILGGYLVVTKVVIPEVIEDVKSSQVTEVVSEVTSDVGEATNGKTFESKEPEIVYPDVAVAMQEIIDKDEKITGELAVTLINRYPEQQFRYIDESKNKQVVFKYLIATEAEIPADAEIEVAAGEGEYVFTKK